MSTVRTFLKTLLGDEIEEGYFLIWTAPDKKSHWFQDPEEAVQFVESADQNKHIYFGIGISPQDYGPSRRCNAKDIKALTCVGVDLDIAHHTKSGKAYFDSKDEARQFLHSTLSEQFQPTVIIDSGHGLIPLWIFNEPWELASNKEKNRAASFLRRFVYTMRYYATLRGRDIDATNDLSRIYRLPGTWNCKDKNNPVQTRIYEETDELFNPDDFDFWLMDPPHEDPATRTDEQTQNYFSLTIDETREEPQERIRILKDTDELFKETWNMTRKDMKGQSLSQFDMALANIAVKYDVPDQEIADMIITFRRKNGSTKKDIEKAHRVSYLSRTIQKAKAMIGWNNADDELDAAHVQLKQHEENSEIPKPNKDKIIDKLQLVLGCPIERVLRYPGDKSTYEIFLNDGRRLYLGTIEHMIEQGKLRKQLADNLQIYLPRYKTDVWDKYAELLLKLVVEEETSLDATTEGQIFQFVRQYVGETQLQEDPKFAGLYKQPFKKKGHTYIFLDKFVEWLGQYKIDRSDLWRTLRRLGSETKVHKFIKTEDPPSFTTMNTYDVTSIMQADYKAKILHLNQKDQQETKTNNQEEDNHDNIEGAGSEDE